MTTTKAALANLQEVAQDATNASVTVEELSGGKISVSVGFNDDSTYSHITIKREAHKVLAGLEAIGWRHCEFGGRKDMGHSGCHCHFACEFIGVPVGESESDEE